MPEICSIWLVNVSGLFPHRNTKQAVCVSVTGNRYLVINTEHRQMYDDFCIKSSEYPFLGGTDRYIACSRVHCFEAERLIKKVGSLNPADTKILIEKMKKSRVLDKIEKNAILPGLEEWLSDNSRF